MRRDANFKDHPTTSVSPHFEEETGLDSRFRHQKQSGTGNFTAAVRLLCSEETVAPSNDDTFVALKAKHPAAPSDRRQALYFKGNVRFLPLQVSPEEVMKSLKTFSAGSAGGPDGLTAQHLWDLLAGAADDKLKTKLSDFMNVVLRGVFTDSGKRDPFWRQTRCSTQG